MACRMAIPGQRETRAGQRRRLRGHKTFRNINFSVLFDLQTGLFLFHEGLAPIRGFADGGGGRDKTTVVLKPEVDLRRNVAFFNFLGKFNN